MRLEVIIPDSARPELKAKESNLVRRLNEDVELLEEILLEDEDAIDRMFTPERLAVIDAAEVEAIAGDVYTAAQIRQMIREKHEAWQQTRLP